jgi:two-component system response regulator AtoC
MKPRVLIVDDDQETRALLETRLKRRDFETHTVASGSQALEELARGDYDVILTDLSMQGLSGIQLCERVAQNRSDVPVIVLTAYGSLDTAIAAIRAGAYDFISKPAEIEVVVIALERALRHRRMREEVKRLRRVVAETKTFAGIIGSSDAMQGVFHVIESAAPSEASILITGESGTGKELVARAIHRNSRRAAGPFVAVNCAALPEALLESELFGHAKGAFTDARAARSGLFVKASGGTILLDEVGDMPLALQPKLLRAIQERTIRPVGGDEELSINVRILAATNRDLEGLVEQNAFREDLYYRLNVIEVHVPPLRARGNDVLLLAQSFVERYASDCDKPVHGMAPQAAGKLLLYDWPGNVRELQNCMERAVALTRYESIAVEDLPHKVQKHTTYTIALTPDESTELVSLEEVERRHILRVFEAVGKNKTLAAQVLKLDRKTLYRKLEMYGAIASPKTS